MVMRNIKIVSMDFDGTLLTSNKKISDKTKRCLADLKNRSYKIIGITARNLLSVKSVLDVNMFDYIILNNGSDVYYVKEDRIENLSSIENKEMKKIFLLFRYNSWQIDFCTPNSYLIMTEQKRDSVPFIRYINKFNDVDSSVSRMNIFLRNPSKLEEYQRLLEKKFKNINVVKMVDTDQLNSKKWLTINPKNVNKLNTLKKICDILECSLDEVIFFGDGENDLVLIENAGISVAMGNAIDSVKEKASYVTLSNDNDGIADYLEKNLKT